MIYDCARGRRRKNTYPTGKINILPDGVSNILFRTKLMEVFGIPRRTLSCPCLFYYERVPDFNHTFVYIFLFLFILPCRVRVLASTKLIEDIYFKTDP